MSSKLYDIINEGRIITEECLIRELGQRWASAFWRKAHYWLTGGAAIAAAVAGFGQIAKLIPSEYAVAITSFLALLAAVLSTCAAVFNPAQKAQAHISLANQYDSLVGRLRRFLVFECRDNDLSDNALNAMEDFARQKDEIKSSGPVVPKSQYKRAKSSILNSETTPDSLKVLKTRLSQYAGNGSSEN